MIVLAHPRMLSQNALSIWVSLSICPSYLYFTFTLHHIFVDVCRILSSPVPETLVPKPPRPIPNPGQPNSKTKLVPRVLELTLKSCGPPPAFIYSVNCFTQGLFTFTFFGSVCLITLQFIKTHSKAASTSSSVFCITSAGSITIQPWPC